MQAATIALRHRCGHTEPQQANPGTEATLVCGAALADCRPCRLARIPTTAYRAPNRSAWRVCR